MYPCIPDGGKIKINPKAKREKKQKRTQRGEDYTGHALIRTPI